MRANRLMAGLGGTTLLLSVVADTSAAQKQRAPIVRISSQAATGIVSNYVEPLVSVSEDAYVFAIAIDLDNQIRVLHPDLPGIAVKLRARQQIHLPNFFAGLGRRDPAAGSYGLAGYGNGIADEGDARGTVIALASRAPFRLELVTAGDDWDIGTIRQLVANRGALSAAAALASHIGARGEPIGRDYMRFAGKPAYHYAYEPGYPICATYYGGYSYFSFNSAFAFARAAQLRTEGHLVEFIGFDACGQPVYRFLQSATPSPRPPAVGAFPKGRIPQGVPRNPVRTEEQAKASSAGDAFTRARVSGAEQERAKDVTVPRMPVAAPQPRTDGAAIGVQSIRDRRPVPDVPARMPERVREVAPPPVIRHHPVEMPRPTPPPPATSQPAPRESKPEPAPAPPPGI